jgi:hypothetical protein
LTTSLTGIAAAPIRNGTYLAAQMPERTKPRTQRETSVAPAARMICSPTPCPLGYFVRPSNDESGAIALSEEAPAKGTVCVASASVEIHGAGDEVVVLRAIVADTTGRHDHG